jgi:anti-sigma factor RsiW
MERVKAEEERLQKFFDGELAPEEEEALRRELEGSPRLAAELAEMEALRTALRGAARERLVSIDSDALFARIEKELAEPTPAAHEAKKPRLELVATADKLRHGRGLAIGLAAAAAVLLVVLARPANGPRSVMEHEVTTKQGSEIVEIDFGSNTGTVFAVEGQAGRPVAVVWINDEEVGLP